MRWLSAVVLVVVLAGCGGSDPSTSASDYHQHDDDCGVRAGRND